MSVRRQPGLVAAAVLTLAVLGSAVATIYARHEARRQFIELQELVDARDELNIDWGRLQIEHSTLAAHGRIEALARERLEMRLPAPDEVLIVRP